MRNDTEYTIEKMRECQALRKKIRELEDENLWLKAVLSISLRGHGPLVIREEELCSVPEFEYAVNLEDELIIRNKAKDAIFEAFISY